MIGIFDSGSGGLTVLKAMREAMPSSDVVYFGDIGNAPYGSKSREELLRLTIGALRLLKERGATAFVSACNSVSASLALPLLDAFSIQEGDLIEMVGPTVSFFKGSDTRILICATPATVDSAIYQDAFSAIGKQVTVLPIPELAGAIEFGRTETDMVRMIADAFRDITLSDFDVLILACTHYPLVMPLFSSALPESLIVFDPAYAVAERAKKQFWPREVGNGTTRFLISQDSALFKKRVATLFDDTGYSIEVV